MTEVVKKSLFGTSGIRGDAESFFTNQFCFDMGRVFSIFLRKNNATGAIAVGNDSRDSSARIKKYFTKGLAYEKRDVFDEGVTSIPSMNYILKAEPNFAGSVMISGSHIKSYLNGLKFFAFGQEISKIHETQISEIYEEEREKISAELEEVEVKNFEHEESRAKDTYIEYLIKLADTPYPNWKVVVDPGDGAQSDTMPQVLKEIGLTVIEMNASVQLEFMSRDTEVSGDFAGLQKKVLDEKADFGIGYDSDGDRVVFIDELGQYISGDYTGAIISKFSRSKKIVTPINTSSVVEHIGKEIIRTKVGSPFVVAAMEDNGAEFGFEANGGGIFSEMKSRDGGRSTIEILNILKRSSMSLSNLVSTLPKFYINRGKMDYKWELKDVIIKKAKDEFKGIKLDETDGLKIWIEDNTWILFRSSANAPEFRVFVESDDETKSKELLEKGLNLVRSIVK